MGAGEEAAEAQAPRMSELIDGAVIRPGTPAASRMELIAAEQKERPAGFLSKSVE